MTGVAAAGAVWHAAHHHHGGRLRAAEARALLLSRQVDAVQQRVSSREGVRRALLAYQ